MYIKVHGMKKASTIDSREFRVMILVHLIWYFFTTSTQQENLQRWRIQCFTRWGRDDDLHRQHNNIRGVRLSGGGPPFHPSVPSSIPSSVHPSKFFIPEEEDDGRGRRRRQMAAVAVYPNILTMRNFFKTLKNRNKNENI